MSKEMQIEEMAKILIDYKNKNNIMASTAILADYAEELYNAGYRKQSVWEWIEVDTIDDGWTQYRCNGCGWNTGSYYKEKYDLHRYCPNCGAKMKGE